MFNIYTNADFWAKPSRTVWGQLIIYACVGDYLSVSLGVTILKNERVKERAKLTINHDPRLKNELS